MIKMEKADLRVISQLISHKLIQFNINQSSMTCVKHILYVRNPDGHWYKNSEQDLCHIKHNTSETLV